MFSNKTFYFFFINKKKKHIINSLQTNYKAFIFETKFESNWRKFRNIANFLNSDRQTYPDPRNKKYIQQYFSTCRQEINLIYLLSQLTNHFTSKHQCVRGYWDLFIFLVIQVGIGFVSIGYRSILKISNIS